MSDDAPNSGTLTPLQRRILTCLSGLRPVFTLTGGGALAGFYLGHRPTRVLDLFFRGQWQLTSGPADAVALLHGAGLEVESLQAGPAFRRLRVSSGEETCLVDLVADPVAPVSPPLARAIDGEAVLVDSPHEILANKLCALLSRSELRDLVDIRALLDSGGDLERAIADAPRKDGGFSPLTLVWLLQDWPLLALARDAGLAEEEARALEGFRSELVEMLLVKVGPS